jgi:hypothetical protein
MKVLDLVAQHFPNGKQIQFEDENILVFDDSVEYIFYTEDDYVCITSKPFFNGSSNYYISDSFAEVIMHCEDIEGMTECEDFDEDEMSWILDSSFDRRICNDFEDLGISSAPCMESTWTFDCYDDPEEAYASMIKYLTESPRFTRVHTLGRPSGSDTMIIKSTQDCKDFIKDIGAPQLISSEGLGGSGNDGMTDDLLNPKNWKRVSKVNGNSPKLECTWWSDDKMGCPTIVREFCINDKIAEKYDYDGGDFMIYIVTNRDTNQLLKFEARCD